MIVYMLRKTLLFERGDRLTMKKKSAVLFLIFMLGLGCIIPNLTIASSDTSPTFNVSDNNNHFTLNFSTDKQLIPGTSLLKSFNINNQESFQIELKHIKLDGLILKKDQLLLSSTDEAYKEFVQTTSFKLTHDNNIIFEGLFKDLFTGNTYIPPVRTFF